MPTPSGGEEQTVSGSSGSHVRIASQHDRRGMPGARVDEAALARVVGGGDDRREGLAELALEHRSGRLHGTPRRESRLEVGAQREAHERGVRERLAAVPGDVADDHRELAVLEREHVVEVPARAGPAAGR